MTPLTLNGFYNKFDVESLERREPDDYRTPFQTDRDRIIYSSAFRRLQAKTQVFLSGEFDFYRTRLTHSLEVAQIGRSICSFLKQTSPFLDDNFSVDPDLVEAICLTHDIGHSPFGHAGERTLHHLMKQYGGFEGNAQSLHIIVDTIYPGLDSRRGMNPTRAFMDGIFKYKRLFREDPEALNQFIYVRYRGRGKTEAPDASSLQPVHLPSHSCRTRLLGPAMTRNSQLLRSQLALCLYPYCINVSCDFPPSFEVLPRFRIAVLQRVSG